MAKRKIDQSPVENLEEDSIAMSTLHPASRPVTDDPKSKIEYIHHVIGAMHAMRSDDLTKWFHQAMDLIGNEACELPAHANEKNNENSMHSMISLQLSVLF